MIIIKKGDSYFNLQYFLHASTNEDGTVTIHFNNGKETNVSGHQWKTILHNLKATEFVDITEKIESPDNE